MPILKKTGIRSTFFPDGSNQQQVEGAEHEQREDATSSEGKNEDGNIILIVSQR